MNQISFSLVLLVFINLVSTSCNNNSVQLQPLDMMSQGLPIKIMAPDSASVEFDDLGIMKDVTVKGQGNFHLQIYAMNTDVLEIKKLIEEAKSEVEDSEFFSEIISEDNRGFIYKKDITEDYSNYDFRSFKLQGDTKYSFQAGMGQQYSLDDIKLMYQAVN